LSGHFETSRRGSALKSDTGVRVDPQLAMPP
jgi:hypothetical protein